MTSPAKGQKPLERTKTIFRPEYKRLLELLKNTREKRCLSQADLGMLLGQDQTFISKYETGLRRLDIIETLDICHVLELDIHHLLREIQQKNEHES